jgi:peptide/nickel transport system substrate-binding protein
VTLNQTDWRFFFKDLTMRFDLGDDDALLAPQMFAGVADADMVALNVYDQAKGWPISTGPYGAGISNDQLSNFDLRPSWWAADTGFVPKYPDVWRLQSIPYTSDTLGAQQLINKEVDQTLDLRPFVVASILAQAEHLKTWTGRKPPYGYLDWWPISVQFCTAKPPFDNPKVRWAIAYAIDQQKVVDIGWNGAGTVAYGPFPNFPKLVALMDGIKDITDQYNVLEYNLDKSAALMTEAGFTKDSEGFWVDAEGKRPDSDIYAAVPLFGDLAPIVAEQLRQAGFFSQHKVPPDVWAAKVDGRASMFLFGHGGATIDPYDTFNLYTQVPPEMGQQSWGNITRWQNADFIAITQEMNNTAMDDPKMKDLFRKGMELYYKELPDCPLVQWYHRIPLNTWYWDNWPDENNMYMNAAIWHLTGFQVVYGLKATDKT